MATPNPQSGSRSDREARRRRRRASKGKSRAFDVEDDTAIASDIPVDPALVQPPYMRKVKYLPVTCRFGVLFSM
jgi:hypothetical protein